MTIDINKIKCQQKIVIVFFIKYADIPVPVHDTVNSLMFAGIYVCVFETKAGSQGLIFAV